MTVRRKIANGNSASSDQYASCAPRSTTPWRRIARTSVVANERAWRIVTGSRTNASYTRFRVKNSPHMSTAQGAGPGESRLPSGPSGEAPRLAWHHVPAQAVADYWQSDLKKGL